MLANSPRRAVALFGDRAADSRAIRRVVGRIIKKASFLGLMTASWPRRRMLENEQGDEAPRFSGAVAEFRRINGRAASFRIFL